MKLDGFIGAAYKLDSPNVDAQECLNLYPEVIESGRGKEARVLYLRGTPGLKKILEVGDGPIRCIHRDSIGRMFVVSGDVLYKITKREDWNLRIQSDGFDAVSVDAAADVDPSTDKITATGHGFYTGLPVHAEISSGGSFPTIDLMPAWGKQLYIIKVDADTFKIATSLSNASSGTALNITADGSGTLTFTPDNHVDLDHVNYDSDINISGNTIKIPDRAFSDGQKVKIFSDGPMPGGITFGYEYYAKVSIVSGSSYLKLSETLSDLVSETYVDITSIPSDLWYALEIGANGLDGGISTHFLSAAGAVHAASMSLGGDGTDSSTLFVDGKMNYVFKDSGGVTSFGPLSGTVQEVTFDFTTNVKVYSYNSSYFSSGYFSLGVQTKQSLPTDEIHIFFYYSSNRKGVNISIVGNDGTHNGGTPVSLSTQELVEFINNGDVQGKNIVLSIDEFDQVAFDSLNASGGDSTDIYSEISSFESEDFSETTYSGLGYDSVPTASQAVWLDGFFIVNEKDTNKFYVSDLQGFNISALSFASSEGNPDIVNGLATMHRDLYIFNEESTEVYANTGNGDFPFERVQGGFIEIGCAAANSVAKINGTLCWLGRSEDGEGIVYAIQGLQPQRISTHAIEQAIRSYADISTATAWAYEDGGHFFYVLNFDEATWVYDLSTKMWHRRGYLNEGAIERHRAQFHAYSSKHKMHLVGDYESNKVYHLSEDYFDDDGSALMARRAAPHVSSDLNRVFYSKFQLDMETGIGLDGGVLGSDPKVMLDWSDDGGHSWSSENWTLADAGSGQIGDFKKRVQWRRLGKSRDRVFRVTMTDPVKRKWIGAHLDVEAGAS